MKIQDEEEWFIFGGFTAGTSFPSDLVDVTSRSYETILKHIRRDLAEEIVRQHNLSLERLAGKWGWR